MRLQLTLAFALAIVAGVGEVGAEEGDKAWSGEVVSRYLLYADDDATTVSTGVIDADLSLPGEVAMGAHILVDAVSSASVDVVTAATKRWTEVRAEAGLRASREIAGTDLGAAYVRSMEEDWSSNTFQLGAGRDFFQRNFRIETKAGVVLNRVGRASDPVFDEKLNVYFGDLGISQLVDKRSRVGLSYGLQSASGYQASGYRYVTAADGSRRPETHPDERMRHWIASYGLRELTELLTARASYRFYWDDWGLRSHTGELRVRLDLSDSLYFAWHARGYQQNDADFYRKGYQEAQVYMSSDRELARFWNVGSGLSIGAQLGPVLVDAKVTLTHYSFKNFAPLSTRLATLAGAGASMPW